MAACFDGAGQADHIDLRMGRQGIADFRAGAVHHVEHACGQSDRIDDFGEDMAVDRGHAAGFDDDGVARYQSGTHFAGNQEEGEVPRQDACHDAQRTFEQ